MDVVPYVQAPVPLTGDVPSLAAAIERELRRISANLIDVTSGVNVPFPRTAAEIAAGVTPTDYARLPEPYDIRREGALVDNSADDTAALNSTLLVGTQSVNGALGAAITVPTGVSLLSLMVTLPNRVRVLGQNKRGSYFQAKPGHPGPWVFNAKNGTSSMFDSTLENVTVDANNVAALGCVLSDAWQEDCGLRGVLLVNFSTIGIRYQNGYGGASLSKIVDTEIFGGTAAITAALAIGIDVQLIGLGGAFLLDVSNTSIVGFDGTHLLDKGVNMVNDSLHARNLHFEYVNSGVYVAGLGTHTLIGVTGSVNAVTSLVEIDANFVGSLTMLGCFRNGATNFIKDNRIKQIASLGAITAGAGYVNGTYTQVPLTGGSGTNATALITVAGGAVTSVAYQNPGTNYAIGDVLSASNANLGGAGAGFSIPVTRLYTGVGTISGIDMPQFTTSTEDSSIRSLATAVAWCVFDGTATGTNPPTNGFNVTSVQRTGTGRYTVNLTRAMANANCAPIATCSNPTLTVAAADAGAASVSVLIDNNGAVATDNSEVKLVVFGS